MKMSGMNNSSSPFHGWTLIEILIVLTILAILSALLFPVFVRCREGARMVTCKANLRQLTQAWASYMQDYDCFAPDGAYTEYALPDGSTIDGYHYTVFWVLMPYINNNANLLICPSRRGWDYANFRPQRGSYAANYQVMGVHESMINEPSRLIVFCDSYLPWQDCVANCSNCSDGCSSFIYDRIGRGYFQGDPSKPTAWHAAGINLAFCDGHVKWKRLEYIFYRNWVLNISPQNPHYNKPITEDW